jgi:hypothetical protein
VPPRLAAAGVVGVPDSAVSIDDLDVPYREGMASVWESVSPKPSWSLEFVFEDPGPTLVRRSADAVLLIVGTREHVGFARLVSGSVSRYSRRHSHCPTVMASRQDRLTQGRIRCAGVRGGTLTAPPVSPRMHATVKMDTDVAGDRQCGGYGQVCGRQGFRP